MAIATLISSAYEAFSMTVRKPVSSFSMLETTDGANIFVAKDGSLMSIVKIDGVTQVVGEPEIDEIIRRMTTNMAKYLGQAGHALQFSFVRDPDWSSEMIKSQLVAARGTARTLDLNLKDLFDERVNYLKNFVVYEAYYVVLWTRLSALSKQERDRARISSKPPKMWPEVSDAQDVFRAARPLRDRHKAFVSSFVQELRDVRIRARVVPAHEGVKNIRASVYPDFVGADWRPTLINDPTPMRHPEASQGDASHLLWPRLDEQIFVREAERVNQRIVTIGSRHFAGIDMAVGPQELFGFSKLLQRMIDADEFPWRASFLIEGDGLSGLGLKAFLASIFSWSSSENRPIKDAIKELQEARLNGTIITKFRASFATWAASDNLALIEERSSRLQTAVESWGYCIAAPTAGDPLACVMSSALGVDAASTAVPTAMPLSDVITLLPWDRDASPWTSGAIMFRTPDKRIWPFQPGSSLQDTFIDIIFAPPGKGKSVYLNTANFASCLSPVSTQGVGGAKLPRIAIIDIGPSSSGLISLLKEALPPSRRHEALYTRLSNTEAFAINPFDTQVGCRHCFPHERQFLINFICAIGTQIGEKAPPKSLAELAGFCVDALYDMYSDENKKSEPKPYIPGVDHAVDEAITRYNLPLSDQPIWWEIVDAFFQRGELHYATLAQRHAVPMLQDIAVILRNPEIADIFEGAKDDGERIISILERTVISAAKEYPILSRPTRFDIGDARVVALDLDEVARGGTGAADKQAALMYMLARFTLAKDFYLNAALLNINSSGGRPIIPVSYRAHHTARIQRIQEVPKRLVYDEFHRTGGSRAVRDQVVVDMREGRKWNVHIALASQLLGDFDEDMVKLASGIWIMGGSTPADAEECQKIFGLSDTATMIVRDRLNGPGPGGAPFLAILGMKDGRQEHLLYNTLSPIEIWAFSTTAEDAALRNRLYARLGAIEARRRLAIRYPTGTAKTDIERRIQIMIESGTAVDRSKAQDGIISQIADEIVDEKASPRIRA
ncbi:hypothetical protein [Bosea sp. RAC05]|uniref:hypothetical protein n=1 Tax=Bosea sp. RAC05 TaxID=1842539 RepID=UPI00083CF3F5|nr:hypothetical protein [Bosea sp. RAC05]AOG02909.1 AAA-like domain protein [Bosea sp. RAC05]